MASDADAAAAGAQRVSQLAKSAQIIVGPLLAVLPPKPAVRRTLPALAPRSVTSPSVNWIVQTYIVPAAFPRNFPGSTKPLQRTRSDDLAEMGEDKIDVHREMIRMLEAQMESEKNEIKSVNDREAIDSQEQLYTCVNRYTRKHELKQKAGATGLSLVMCHANGFHKEIWEPTITELFMIDDATTAPIDEIWSLDAINQGDAAIINEEVLGNTFNWADHGRDILNFIISYVDSSLPALSSPSTLSKPILLSPQSLSDPSILTLDAYSSPNRSSSRKRIVGIGHSLGGGGLTFAASSVPSLFSSIILVDPVLPPADYMPDAPRGLAAGAIVRRDEWASRASAQEVFLKKAFFRLWEASVLQSYLQFGLKDVRSGTAVQLKARKKDEALVFSDPGMVGSKRAWVRLASIPPTLPVHFLLADIDRSVLVESTITRTVARVPHATSSRLKGAGHLVVQEDPKGTASTIAQVLKGWYPIEVKSRL